MNEADEILARGWTQGCILRSADFGLVGADSHLLISHPCDIVSADFERDPSIEVLPIRSVDEADGNLTFGKNSRRLHIVREGVVIEVAATEKLTLDRRALATRRPSGALDEADQRLLSSWLAARYSRPAFADEFNRRLRPALRPMAKVLKGMGSRLSGIYVATTALELDQGTPYQLTLVVTMLADDFIDPKLFAEGSEACDGIIESLRAVAGISLASVELVSEDEFSLDALRRFRRWDYADLSYRVGDVSTLPAAD